MEFLNTIDALKIVCIAKNKWGMYLSTISDIDDAVKAAPWLGQSLNIILDGDGIVLFDSEEEMLNCFHQTVGDEGPTETNPYDGPGRVYALTCDPNGVTHNENT